jgi:Ca-activated chloride channel family protein
MKLILAIFLLINPLTDLDKIARVNAAKKEAERAYLGENYELARDKYIYLKDSLGVKDDNLLLNLANSQYLLNDSVSAQATYKSLKESDNKRISSIANQQLGAMQFKAKKYKESLQHYKDALRADPGNSDARYNYELLKKIIKEQEEQQENQDQQNQDQQNQEQNKDQQNKDQQNQEQNKEQQEEQEKQEQKDQEQKEQEEKEQKENQEEQQKQEEQKPEDQQKKEEKEEQAKPNPIDEEKLKEMKISEEKAMLILEAMKNNEIQYIQQNKRKAKKKKDPSKPDW